MLFSYTLHALLIMDSIYSDKSVVFIYTNHVLLITYSMCPDNSCFCIHCAPPAVTYKSYTFRPLWFSQYTATVSVGLCDWDINFVTLTIRCHTRCLFGARTPRCTAFFFCDSPYVNIKCCRDTFLCCVLKTVHCLSFSVFSRSLLSAFALYQID